MSSNEKNVRVEWKPKKAFSTVTVKTVKTGKPRHMDWLSSVALDVRTSLYKKLRMKRKSPLL